ncbi:MAG TPA: FtsX-like permease family protein, partial [Acidimicrobiales bacterium]|nr:FtsX-like permease family protein [Acidimicrobiales bacterium]
VLFAVGSYTVEANNRSRVAAFETGASEVVDVSLPPGLDLVDAVRRADPSGRQAMAAALYSSSSENLLAVDASRLAAVASWPSGLSPQSEAEIARLLTPRVHPAITFHGNRLRVTVSLPAHTPQIILTAALFDTVYDTPESVAFGPIRDGTHTYTAYLQGACARSCRLDSLSPEWWSSNAFDTRLVHIDVRAMAADPAGTWRPIAFGAGERESWHAQTSGVGISTTARSEPGLSISIPGDQLLSGGVIVAPSDLPQSIPAVVTSDLVHSSSPTKKPASITASGLDGNALTASALSIVPAIPEVGKNALLVDLPLAERAQTGAAVGATDQVWLAPSASPLILERLRHLGVAIGPISSTASRLNALNHRGLALAYDLALIVTPIAALLALGIVIFAIGSEAGTKRREIAALSAAGVDRRSLGRAVWLENGLVLVVAVVLGSAIGFAADAIAIPSLPLFTNGSGGLPLTTGLPLGTMLLTVAALIVALGTSVAATSHLVFRSSFFEHRRDDQ